MKKSINKFILSISLIFLFTGCDDYVDYEASENYQIVADDYFKIKNVQLGYNFNLDSSSVLDEVRLYLQGKNLMTFTDYSGYDPEMSYGVLDTGIDRGNYPSPRTVSVGLNVKF